MTDITTGFTVKKLDQIKSELEAKIADELNAVIDFSPDTPDGQLSGVIAEAQATLWQLASSIYLSQYPSTAAGASLDRVVELNNIKRIPAQSTVVDSVEVIGLPGTLIQLGARVATTNGRQFQPVQVIELNSLTISYVELEVNLLESDSEYTITVGANTYTVDSELLTIDELLQWFADNIANTLTATVVDSVLTLRFGQNEDVVFDSRFTLVRVGQLASFKAVEPGPYLLQPNTLTTIVTPVLGFQSVNNRDSGTIGTRAESDQELRVRRKASIGINAQGTLESIVANLRQVPGVLSVTAAENNGEVIDGNGIPPQHIWVIVAGGANTQVAETIHKFRAAGIGMKGSTVVPYVSPVTNNVYNVRFDRPVIVPVYITLNITTNSDFPLNGSEQIKEALQLMSVSMQSGETLYYSRLFTAINSVPGHFVTELFLGTSSSPSGTSNISVALNQLIEIAPGRTVVNVNI